MRKTVAVALCAASWSCLARTDDFDGIHTAVLSFSPYQHWNSETLHDELEEIVSEFDVRYRIGLARDVTYGADTVPIVFWNPRVIDLP